MIYGVVIEWTAEDPASKNAVHRRAGWQWLIGDEGREPWLTDCHVDAVQTQSRFSLRYRPDYESSRVRRYDPTNKGELKSCRRSWSEVQ